MKGRQHNTTDHHNTKSAASTSASVGASLLANGITYTFFHPLSTALNRMQMRDQTINSIDLLRKTIFAEAHNKSITNKCTSLFTGSLSGLCYKLASRTLRYAGQPVIAEKLENQHKSTAEFYFGEVHGKSLLHAIAGGSIAALEVLLLHPFNTFKTKRQANDMRPIKQLYKTEKISSFYNGYGMAFFKAIPAAFVLFGTNAGVMSYYHLKDMDEASLKHNIIAATCGVTMSALVINPQDVVIKRAQITPHPISSFGLLKDIIKQDGLRGLYRGFTLNLLTSLPKKAAPFALYGYFMQKWQSEQHASDNETNLKKRV